MNLATRCRRTPEWSPVLWLRSALFTVLLPGTVLLWVPLWLSALAGERLDLGVARWVGVPLVVIGAASLLWCIWDFARRGKGTLAPVDPPRFVVRSGLYRVVRNPMYLSVLTVLVGEAVLFGSLRLVAWAVIVASTVHLFVVAYEEPSLRRQFGVPYEEYCGAVTRWFPRRPRR
jgi:protein-S-isoprenylcysteine O-methyltransferase Ste14